MKLYHGSDMAVSQPLAKVGRHNLVFGEGFYVTKLRKQAEDWAQVIAERKGRKVQPTVSQYLFDRNGAEANGLRFMSDARYGLQQMSDQYILEDILKEIRNNK